MQKIKLVDVAKATPLVLFLIGIGLLIGFFIFKNKTGINKSKFLEEVPTSEYTKDGQAIKRFNEMFYTANQSIPVPQRYISLAFSKLQLATMESAFSMDTNPHGPRNKYHGFRLYPMMYTALEEPDITKRFHVLIVPEFQVLDKTDHVTESTYMRNTNDQFGLYNHMDPSPPGPSNEADILITLLNAQ